LIRGVTAPRFSRCPKCGHRPLLVFHDAGHLIFRIFGEWVGVLGGTLNQMLLSALVVVAFLWKHRDPFGAAIGLCLLVGPSMAADASAWFDAGRPSAQAQQAVALLADAASHGLDPRDYDGAALQQALSRATQGLSHDAAAGLEQALTLAMQRYLTDLHDGRIDPRSIRHDFNVSRRGPFDAAQLLRRLPPEAAVRAATPQLPLYGQLRELLARYRALADDAAWRRPLPPLPAAARGAPRLEPGQDWVGVPLLADRLVALGDLPASTPRPPRYQGALVDAVRSFQQRHALDADGVVGAATLARLQVVPAARVRQIELMLERLRWTPLLQGPRMVVINIPEFVLRAYEVRDGRIRVQREMRVIVGKAYDTRTPLFDEDMRFIEFSPYWNVPPSIARHETVPRLRRDPGHFEQQGFEFVDGDGRVQTALTPQALDAVLAGQMRIRQRPGEHNALGDIKFAFPNRDNIYLHHTPATRLFERARRDFSHGCIRVEQPVELASFVLQGMPQWSETRIRETMSAGHSSTLRLAEPVPVLIAYGTVLVKGGRAYFFDDLYGLDRVLDDALRQRPPRPPIIRQ
jgi:murein L,D-transpeptidase YcbB/YkuD